MEGLIFLNFTVAVSTIEPAGKASFVYSGMRSWSIQCKMTMSLFYVSKVPITAITAIRFCQIFLSSLA